MATPAASSATPSGARPAEPNNTGKLGTFAGVFTPSVLTILGLILFLRLGRVVGDAGLTRALIIIVLANVISLLTSTSLAAIATNLRVKGGGDYYLISRTLGVEFGGALGLVLFLAQSISIAFYCIGFGEVVASLAGAEAWVGQAVAGVAVAGLFVLAWLGADAATRFQYVVMGALFAAITAFFIGGLGQFDGEVLAQNTSPSGETPFWVLFALFFPAVTGFTQGVSMSGDLADPGKSLPRGTFLAVFISLGIYIAMAIVFAGAAPGAELASDDTAMRRISAVGWLIDLGVIAATLSSALASFLGAPRILQSLASDRVFGFLKPFAVVDAASGNPRRGVLLAAGIAFATIALGNLDAIASVVTMFFLISYGLLNFATWFEARGKSPSFRPRFRWFDERLSLLGALGCVGAMIAVEPTAGAGALVVLAILHQVIARGQDVPRWADGGRSYHFQRIRSHLLSLGTEPGHARDWRPVLLAFSDDPRRRRRLLRFASWIEGGSGFTTAVRIVEGGDLAHRRQAAELQTELARELSSDKVEAYPLVVAMANTREGLPVLLQGHGLGGIRPNLVLLNWFDGTPLPEGSFGMRRYGRPLRTSLRHGCHVVILEATTEEMGAFFRTPLGERRIDLWYRDDPTGHLMLMLAYLMTRTDDWATTSLRVYAARGEERSLEEAHAELTSVLAEARIEAEAQIVESVDHDVVTERSRDATIVLLPFVLRDECPTTPFDCPLDELVDDLPITAFVSAAADLDLSAEPESGQLGEIARAADTAQESEDRARQAEKDAAKSAEAVQALQAKVDALSAEPELPEGSADASTDAARTAKDESARLRSELDTAIADAEDKRRRALKARAKANDATREADSVKRGDPPSTAG